ncbi:unnamed protein product [Ceutorhynchus assimilis]|uniref:Ubinuclein-1 n=1 Tax=Ceutorhynchus assimilis TaxID=467358 RepID=A0A9N9MFX2_9CUCU|nr:unnamed protein product [Ceutorhynchus assimilis]
MSDIKRVSLTSFEPPRAKPEAKKHSRTVRIRVKLPESNEDKCPEFNYKDELAAAKKKLKQNGKEPNNVPNGLDPFGEENDDDVRRIALEMEAKYGNVGSSGPKKKRQGRKDDYADIGAGYDESDSFIDDTDGYDEIIPHNVTTARGGFYINSGALEFKKDDEITSEVSSSSSSSESEEEEKSPEKVNRKRVLDTTDEEEEDSNKSAPAVVAETPNISMHQAIKKKLFSTEKIQIKKRKLADQQKNTVKELLREKRTETSNINANNSSDKDTSKENKKPMKLSSVDDTIDSVINREILLTDRKIENKIVLPESIIPESNRNGEQLLDTDASDTDTSKQEYVKLPENLPADISELIENIKAAAANYKDGKKLKFFSGDVNTMLLNLERKCKVLGRSSRARVYEHLAPFVRCRKETLMKRAKNLVYQSEQQKLTNTIANLRGQIDRLMPALQANYDLDCQRMALRKLSQEVSDNETIKQLNMPRRRFPLHEDMKQILRDIVTSKRRCFIHEGQPKTALENILIDYLKTEILGLWPDGWMSMAVLKKFFNSVPMKTPDPKLLIGKQQKAPSNNVKPLNLGPKLNEVRQDKIVQTIIVPEKVKNHADNGVIVLGSSKIKDESSVIHPNTHCQIIDLTDTPKSSQQFQKLKEKFPNLSVTTNHHLQNDPDDVQKVMESLKALQQLSSPSKGEISNPAVSVIAINKNYSNSSSQNSAAASKERTSFSGAFGYHPVDQKQLFASTSKTGFNNK